MTDDCAFGAHDVAGALYSGEELRKLRFLMTDNTILPLRPGLPERQTHDYKRHGTTTLFAAFNILNGKVIGSCLPRHRAKEFIRFLNHLEKEVPPDIHLIMDNYSTHKSAAVQRWLKPTHPSRGSNRHSRPRLVPAGRTWVLLNELLETGDSKTFLAKQLGSRAKTPPLPIQADRITALS